LAVDVAEHARAAWEAEGRPIRDTFANGMSGVSPYLKAWEQLDAQAARFADALGLTPSSRKRISGVRGAGRPLGATSSADRKALPPLRLAPSTAALVNRSRGHGED
jgi:phage terminase small subunit